MVASAIASILVSDKSSKSLRISCEGLDVPGYRTVQVRGVITEVQR